MSTKLGVIACMQYGMQVKYRGMYDAGIASGI